MKRHRAITVWVITALLLPCVAFTVSAEMVDIDVTVGAGYVSGTPGIGYARGFYNDNTSGVQYGDGASVPVSVLSKLFEGTPNNKGWLRAGDSIYTRLTVDIGTENYDFSNGFMVYLAGGGSLSLRNLSLVFRTLDNQLIPVDVDASVLTVGSYVPFAVSGNYGYTSFSEVYIDTGYSLSGVGGLNLGGIKVAVPEPIPPLPPDPPSYGGGMNNFTVTAKNSGTGYIGFYYEDIVNRFYSAAIENEAYSYAQYPYTTVLSFLSDNDLHYYLVATDKPLVKETVVEEGRFVIGSYDYGVSGVVFDMYAPAASLMAGEEYSFQSMTAYTNIGPNDFIRAVTLHTRLPNSDGSFVQLYGPASLIMSNEGDHLGYYAMCTNYAVSVQDVFETPLKQSFKFADTWAQLLRYSQTADTSALLQEILESLRSTDMTVTVYERIDQIYQLMSDTSQLAPDNPVQSQLDESIAALEEWADSTEPPDIDSVILVTEAVGGSLDALIVALGALGVVGIMGLVLGVIKVALQR